MITKEKAEKYIKLLMYYEKNKNSQEINNLDTRIDTELINSINNIDCEFLKDYDVNQYKQNKLKENFDENIIQNSIKIYLEEKGITPILNNLVETLNKQGHHSVNILKDDKQRKLLVEFLIDPVSAVKNADFMTIVKFSSNSRGLNKGLGEMREIMDNGELSLKIVDIIKEPVNFFNKLVQKYGMKLKNGEYDISNVSKLVSDIEKIKTEVEEKFKNHIDFFKFLKSDKDDMNFVFSKIVSRFIIKVENKCKNINSENSKKIKETLIDQFKTFSENKTTYFIKVIGSMLKDVSGNIIENSSEKISGKKIDEIKNITITKTNECLENPEKCKEQLKPFINIVENLVNKK